MKVTTVEVFVLCDDTDDTIFRYGHQFACPSPNNLSPIQSRSPPFGWKGIALSSGSVEANVMLHPKHYDVQLNDEQYIMKACVLFGSSPWSGRTGGHRHATRQPTPLRAPRGVGMCPLMSSALPRLGIRVFKSCTGKYRRTYTASSFVMHAAEEPLLEFQTPDRRWPRCQLRRSDSNCPKPRYVQGRQVTSPLKCI